MVDQFEAFMARNEHFKSNMKEFWLKIQERVNEEERFPEAALERATEVIAVKEARDTILKPTLEIIKPAMEVFMSPKVVGNIFALSKHVPWMGPVFELAGLIIVGIQDVKENQENFRRLNDFIIKVICTIEHSSKKGVDMFKEACADTNLEKEFNNLMAEGIKLVAKYQKRRGIVKFVMRKDDRDEFLNIYTGLSATLTLLNTNMIMMQQTKQLDELDCLHKFFQILGNGDTYKGKNLLKNKDSTLIQKIKNNEVFYDVPKAEDFQNTYGKQREEMLILINKLGGRNLEENCRVFQEMDAGRFEDEEKQQIYKAIIELVPYSAKPALELSQNAEKIIDNLMRRILPGELSEELKQFWVDAFGYTEQVHWPIFLERVEVQNKVFLESEEVKHAYAETGLHLTNYLLKQKLDIDADDMIASEELCQLYNWCMEVWKKTAAADGDRAPKTIKSILQLLMKQSVRVNNDIMDKKTLDLHFIGIYADWVEDHIVQNYKHKLVFIETLDSSQNPIGDHGARAIFKTVRKYMPNLNKLRLEDCGLENKLDGIEYIVPQLDELILENNKIGDQGLDLIIQGLQQIDTKSKHQEQLQQVLQQQHHQLQLLPMLLMQSQQQLQSMGVHKNILPEINTASLSNAINNDIATQQLKYADVTLQVLNLAKNSITDKGMKKLFLGIAKGSIKIKSKLEISENQMTRKVFPVIKRAVLSKEDFPVEFCFNGYEGLQDTRQFRDLLNAIKFITQNKKSNKAITPLYDPEPDSPSLDVIEIVRESFDNVKRPLIKFFKRQEKNKRQHRSQEEQLLDWDDEMSQETSSSQEEHNGIVYVPQLEH